MNILQHIRKSFITKVVALLLAAEVLTGNLWNNQVYALTSGPSQPEANTFQQIDITESVDPFTGDFSYNIPLLEVGGYPLNLSYNSGITMDQEASWAGLGWNVNIGSITRALRGLPDDFSGDPVIKRLNVKPNETAGVSLGLGFEITGVGLQGGNKADVKEHSLLQPSLDMGITFSYNNYTGYDLGTSWNHGLSIGKQGKPGGNISLGMSSSRNGLNISPNASFSYTTKFKSKEQRGNFNVGFGTHMNSRSGAISMSFDGGFSVARAKSGVTNKGNARELQRGGGMRFGGSLGFASPSYTPEIDMPYETEAFTMEAQVGGAIKWWDVDGKVGGFGTRMKLQYKELTSPAFGYCYSQDGQLLSKALHDFNREKDGSFTPNTRYLPVTNHTYDIYQINAQGVGGNFRPFRNDFGYVYDQAVHNPSTDGSLAIEVSIGDIVDVGINVNVASMNSRSKKWTNNNDADEITSFQKKQVNKIEEPFVFRLVGDMGNTRGQELYKDLAKDKPIRFNIESKKVSNILVSNYGFGKTLTEPKQITGRQSRNTSVEHITVAEVKRMYPYLAGYIPYYAQDHHIGAIIIVTPEGLRYVFGLPAYNRVQKETTFAVSTASGQVTVDSQGMVSYSSNANSTANDRGIDHYFEETETGPYVHTWMLTAVLSPDYVDVTGDGPTEDDLGTYTSFFYGTYNTHTQKYAPDLIYHWRTPACTSANKALHYEGLKSLGEDDKGNIVYGIKDVWYVNRIESKNHVAVFTLGNRDDGYGVTGINAAVGGQQLKRLERIDLYSREDYLVLGTGASPIKSVHFGYDYSLCDKVPNNLNGEGKLTLKQVYFTYEKSGLAKFSPYIFEYAATNPDYHPLYNDRWGNYKVPDPSLKNADYPYTEQDKTLQDTYANAWNLTGILLPSGGKMNVEYESDDYAYVQDLEAAKMFKVLGASKLPDDPAYTNDFFTENDKEDPHLYLYFALDKDHSLGGSPDFPTTSDAPDIKAYIHKRYLHGLDNNPNGPGKYLYFRFLTNLNRGVDAPKNDYVSGYAELDLADADYCGAILEMDGKYKTGWVKLKGVQTDDNGSADAHPVSKAGWQFSRIYTPRFAYNLPEPTAPMGEAMIQQFVNSNIITLLIEMSRGQDNRMRSNGYAAVFDPGKSWIRLMEPNGRKLGGGCRVKKITISDEWDTMTSEAASVYGQEFIYELEDGRSSGVAAWEPMLGGDENIHRIPSFYEVEKTIVPDERFYQELPMGESFYPAPVVGYSHVKVRNITPAGISVNATGHIEYEFYTAKDYPTIALATDIKPIRQKPFPLAALMGFSYDYMTVSQGYVIEMNDMHGKPKEERVYQENKPVPITKKVYHYKESAPKRLSSLATVITPSGDIIEEEIGIDFDIIADFRESSSATFTTNVSANLGYTSFGVAPALSFMLMPKFQDEETLFRSSVVTKVIRRSGILDSIEVFDLGARAETKNIARDQLTGEVLLTQVNNEFEDDRFALKIPAHWVYEGMGLSGTNWGYEFDTYDGSSYYNWDRSNGTIATGSDAEKYLVPGDELIAAYTVSGNYMKTGWGQPSAHFSRLWVYKASDGTLFLLNAAGNKFTGTNDGVNYRFKVIHSGRRNMQSAAVQTVEMLENPIVNGKIKIALDRKVLNTAANEYNEVWKTYNTPLKNFNYNVLKCEATSKGNAFVRLLNLLKGKQKLITNGQPYGLDDHTTLVEEMFGSNCAAFLTSSYGVNYTSSIPALSNNAYISLMTTYTCGEDTEICNMQLISAEPSTEVNYTKLLSLEHLEIVTAFSSNDTYLSNLYTSYINTGDLLLLGSFTDGSTAYFILDNVSGCDLFGFFCQTTNIKYGGICNIRVGGDPPEIWNPYVWGLLGNWRVKKSYTYLTDRENNLDNITPREDGYFKTFAGNIWKIPVSSAQKWTLDSAHISSDKWKWASEVTEHNPFGQEVENKNALGIYAAALYGYRQSLPTAVAQNCKQKELAYDGFEDYYAEYFCHTNHFRFESHKNNVVTDQAHTGRYSLKIESGTNVSTSRTITLPHTFRTNFVYPYAPGAADLLGIFAPDEINVARTYLVSYWIKRSDYDQGISPYIHDYGASITCTLRVNTSDLTATLKRKSDIIEGWQMFEYEFTIPVSSSGIFHVIFGANPTKDFYLDDVRIHPVDATMKSFVYDYRTLKYMAELDENNFATFYEYDENGSLVRVKKETERGIMTIQENRSKLLKKDITY